MNRKWMLFWFIVIVFLAMEVKVRLNAMEPAGYATGVYIKSANGVVWQITVDDNGILGTDSVGVTQ